MAESSIEWTDATWNPTTGCDRTSPGCDHCLAPETPVLMADMTWQPIGKLAPGDEVVAFTESPAVGQNRVFERAAVVHAWTTIADAVEITMGDRSIVASIDHRFLAPHRPYWREAEQLDLHATIVDLGLPPWLPHTESEPYLAGYLAGAVIGDGTFRIDGSGKQGTNQSYLRVAVLESDRPIVERLVRGFAAFGCTDLEIHPFFAGTSALSRAGERLPLLKVETRRMANLMAVRKHCMPERADPDWKAGFLAGFFDTDGSYSGGNLRFHQTKSNGALDAVHRYVSDLGFESHREDFRSTTGRSERIVGSTADKIRFLATIGPALTRRAADFYGRRFPTTSVTGVDAVRRVGVRELVDIETTSGTFIAAGFATHNCYALTLAGRLKAMGQAKYQNDGDARTSGPGFGLTLHPDVLEVPRRLTRPRMIFVNSMSDLFHPDVPLEFIQDVFAVMSDTPQHTYQVLTKRSKRAASVADRIDWPWNVWMGVSIENQGYAFRADHLRDIPAAIRFVSLEPLLGPVSIDLDGIHWVIVGGESGRGARSVDPAWVMSIRDACVASDTPFFFKQWGGRTPKAGGRELDGRTWDQYPATAQPVTIGVSDE